MNNYTFTKGQKPVIKSSRKVEPFYLKMHKQVTAGLSLTTIVMIYIGIALFLLSLLLASLFTSGGDIEGYWVLILGWMGFVIFQFSWFANPLNLLAIFLVNQRPTLAAILSIFAFLLASQTFYFYEIPTGAGYGRVYIKELGLGFYLWYTAHGLILVGMLVAALSADTKKRGHPSLFDKLINTS